MRDVSLAGSSLPWRQTDRNSILGVDKTRVLEAQLERRSEFGLASFPIQLRAMVRLRTGVRDGRMVCAELSVMVINEEGGWSGGDKAGNGISTQPHHHRHYHLHPTSFLYPTAISSSSASSKKTPSSYKPVSRPNITIPAAPLVIHNTNFVFKPETM